MLTTHSVHSFYCPPYLRYSSPPLIVGQCCCPITHSLPFYCRYMWSVVGLHIWAGAFNYCNDANQADENGVTYFRTYTNYPPRIKDQEECISKGLDWVMPNNTFNNLGASLWSVFIIFTMDFWHPIMFDAISANQSPGGNSVFWGHLASFFYFLFAILCFIVLIYLFISVIYSTFTYLNSMHEGKHLLSLKQAFWAQYYNKVSHSFLLDLSLGYIPPR